MKMSEIGIYSKGLLPILCLIIGVSSNPIQQQQPQQQNATYPYAYPNYYETQPYPPYGQPQGYPSYSDFPGAAAGARGSPYDPTAPQFDLSAYQPLAPAQQTYIPDGQPEYGVPAQTYEQPEPPMQQQVQGGAFPQSIYGGGFGGFGGQGGYYGGGGGQYPGQPGFDPYWCYRNSQQCAGFQWCGGGGQQIITPQPQRPIVIYRPSPSYVQTRYVTRIQYVPQIQTRVIYRDVPRYITRYVQIPIVRPVYYIPKVQCYVRYTAQYGQSIQQQPIYSQQQEQQQYQYQYQQYQPQGCYGQGQGQVGQIPSGCVDGGAGYGAGAGYGYGYGYGLQADQQQIQSPSGAESGAEYSGQVNPSVTGAGLGSTGAAGVQP